MSATGYIAIAEGGLEADLDGVEESTSTLRLSAQSPNGGDIVFGFDLTC